MPACKAGGAFDCAGDCNGDGAVVIDDLIKGVDIALDALPLAQCPSSDADGDHRVTVEELIAAVDAALNGCEKVDRSRKSGPGTDDVAEVECRVPVTPFRGAAGAGPG